MSEYDRNLPDETHIKMSRREWGLDIAKYNREQINKGMEWIHNQKINHEDNWQFMDIGRCIGAIKNANQTKAAHKIFQPDRTLEDKGAKERAKKAGDKAMADLKSMFD